MFILEETAKKVTEGGKEWAKKIGWIRKKRLSNEEKALTIDTVNK